MKRLVFADGIYGSLCALACQFRGEFAVTLFGDVRGEDYCVSHIAPPGKNADNDFAHCTNDAEFEADVFHQLRRKNPEIRYLGDLHAHPPGLRFLSGTDRRTIRHILLDADDTLHPDEYVAGVLLRTGEGLAIYPRHFTKQDLAGSAMEVDHEGIRKKPARTGSFVAQAYRYCRDRLARQRHRRHGGAGGHRDGNADRS